jgi:hypothetical protein
VERQFESGVFPPGFPSELVAAAFCMSNEAAWQPPLACVAVEWLMANGYAVLGTEALIPLKNGGIQSLGNIQSVNNREDQEPWGAFVDRAATETLEHLRDFANPFPALGDVYINMAWVDEAEYQELESHTSSA